ncbi:hypothetical protein ACVIJ6_004860 [Bradyrhizobium sp. USDA 4369]
MWFALGAASSVLDGLQSLGSTKSGSGKSGNGGGLFGLNAGGSGSSGLVTPWSSSSSSGSGQIAPETMNALLAAQSQSGTSSSAGAADPLQDLFSLIDGDGDGKITKSEFESALGAGGTNLANADKVFGKLDSDGDGNVSFNELGSALKGGHHGRRHQAGNAGGMGTGASSAVGGSSSAGADALMQALSGASSSSSTNSDGSTTTIITYADGSKMTLITPAATTGSNAAISSYNMIEQLMQRQPKLQGSTTSTTSVTA